jgi:putative addiction module component (TIGR02574 family)
MSTLDEVWTAAQALSEQSRADLALRLLESLPASPAQAPLSPELQTLLLDRVARYESGRVGGEDAFMALDRLRQKLGQRQAS